jgi:hypothetical protein
LDAVPGAGELLYDAGGRRKCPTRLACHEDVALRVDRDALELYVCRSTEMESVRVRAVLLELEENP